MFPYISDGSKLLLIYNTQNVSGTPTALTVYFDKTRRIKLGRLFVEVHRQSCRRAEYIVCIVSYHLYHI